MCQLAFPLVSTHTVVCCQVAIVLFLNVSTLNGSHPHEGRFLHGVQQADPQVIALVVHGDHVECHGFRHGQDDGQEPD